MDSVRTLHGIVGQSAGSGSVRSRLVERGWVGVSPRGGLRQWLLARLARVCEHGADDQHQTHDQPWNGVEVLIASTRRGRVPASGARSITLDVRDEERHESRSCKQAEC